MQVQSKYYTRTQYIKIVVVDLLYEYVADPIIYTAYFCDFTIPIVLNYHLERKHEARPHQEIKNVVEETKLI